ncbi:jg3654, partial [Pararge aegeria aegeria]
MAGFLACRVCLATDNVKLYDMCQFNFVTAYEILTGVEFTIQDGLPQHICNYCSTQLMKCITFKEKCCTTREILLNAIGQNQELTLESLRTINHQFALNLVHETKYPDEYIEYTESEIKEEVDSIDYVDFKADEPKRKKRKKKKIKQEIEDIVKLEDDEIKKDIYDDDDPNDTVDSIVYDSDAIQEEPPTSEDLKDVEVVYLSKADQLSEIEQRKTSSNYINSFYKCDKCFKGFITDATYR